ncbi:unnamed protein product [Withania somnifera]
MDRRPKPSDYDVQRDYFVFGSFSMDLFCAKSDLDLSVNFANEKRNGFAHGVNPVTTARVPVLKVVDRGTEIECDMSVENWDGISKSNTIYMISAIDERFRKLSFLTRNPPILPPFSALFRDGNESVAVEKSLCKFSNYGISNKESVAELFVSLLNKLLSVEKLWSEGLCASTFEGSWISKTWGSRVGHTNVEDFADRSQNVARAVGAEEHIFDFLNKKIEGNSLRKFLFGQDVASKLGGAGTVKLIAKEIQARASGKKKIVHVESILTKSMSSVESPRWMPQGKLKLVGPSWPTESFLTKRRTYDCLGGTFSEWWEPVVNRAREAVYNRAPPVSFATQGRMRLAQPSGVEILRQPNLIAPAVPHTFPLSSLGSQIFYEPFRHPIGYSNSVCYMHPSSYCLPLDPRRF